MCSSDLGLSDLSGGFAGHGHQLLWDCCLTQLSAFPSRHASPAASLWETVSALHQANTAQRHGIDQAAFSQISLLSNGVSVEKSKSASTRTRPVSSASSPRETSHMLSGSTRRGGLSSMLEIKRYGPPIFGAPAAEGHDAAQAFIEALARSQPLESPLRDLCKGYAENRRKRAASFGRDFMFSRGTGIY